MLYTDQKTQAQRIKLHEAMNLDLNGCSLSLFSLLLFKNSQISEYLYSLFVVLTIPIFIF